MQRSFINIESPQTFFVSGTFYFYYTAKNNTKFIIDPDVPLSIIVIIWGGKINANDG